MRTPHSEQTTPAPLLAALSDAGAMVTSAKVIRCPFHEDHTPSMSAFLGNDGVWRVKCHTPACGFMGDVFDVIAKAKGVAVGEVLKGTAAGAKPTKRFNPGTTAAAGKEPAKEAQAKVYATIAELQSSIKGTVLIRHEYLHPDTGAVILCAFRIKVGKDKKRFELGSPVDGGWVMHAPPKPWPLYNLPAIAGAKSIVIVEGEKCVDALTKLGIVATTSPAGAGNAKHAEWGPLAGKEIVIWGDNDESGRKYVEDVMAQLARLSPPPTRVRVVDPVQLGLPEKGDVVDYIGNGEGASEAVVQAFDDAAEITLPTATDEKSDEEAERRVESGHTHGGSVDRTSQAEQVVTLAMELCSLFQTPKREPFAVLKAGPNVAAMLSGNANSLRDLLAREYRRRNGKVMNATAFADAIATLRGEALEAPTAAVHLRVGTYADGVVLDCGTVDGTAVVIDPNGWRLVERSPIVFQRTALTGAIPLPERGGRLEALRGLVNVSDDTWPVLVGWMVAALIPDMPHPILMIGGTQGTGKSTAGKYICGIFDHSDAPLRSQPRNPEEWAISVANAWTTAIDNVSSISQWWSDALCKAVTGDGWVRRTLYSNGEVTVLNFRRVIAITSIDAGDLRGDLGERMVLIDLEPIGPGSRLTEYKLEPAYQKARPAILGALLDLLAGVLARRDSVSTKTLPRMADFARVLAAVDETLGNGMNSLALYAGQESRIASEVLDADPVGVAVTAFMKSRTQWSGTATDLLTVTKPADAGREWPANGRAMCSRLKRIAPALAVHGVRVVPPAKTDRTRTYLLESTAQTAQPPENGPGASETPLLTRAVENADLDDRPNRPDDRPDQNTPEDASRGRNRAVGRFGRFQRSRYPATSPIYEWEESP
jgi:hypothetical protein